MAYKTKFDGTVSKTITLGVGDNPTSIEGYFLGSKDVSSDFGPGKLHIFQTADGHVGVWGKTRLNGLLTQDLVGQMVLATFTGMIAPSKKGRRPSYGFKVQHDPENLIDVTGVNLGAPVSQETESGEGLDDNSEDDNDFVNDSVAYIAPVAPKTPASVPNSDAKARLQAMLAKTKVAR